MTQKCTTAPHIQSQTMSTNCAVCTAVENAALTVAPGTRYLLQSTNCTAERNRSQDKQSFNRFSRSRTADERSGEAEETVCVCVCATEEFKNSHHLDGKQKRMMKTRNSFRHTAYNRRTFIIILFINISLFCLFIQWKWSEQDGNAMIYVVHGTCDVSCHRERYFNAQPRLSVFQKRRKRALDTFSHAVRPLSPPKLSARRKREDCE